MNNDDPFCVCSEYAMPIMGDEDSPGLIIISEPSSTDIAKGRFCSNSWEMFVVECSKQDIPLRTLRKASLYPHPNYEERCATNRLEQLMSEIMKSKVILSIGSDVSEVLLGRKVKSSWVLTTTCVFDSKVKVVICPSLGTVFVRTLGELKLALEKFKKELDK